MRKIKPVKLYAVPTRRRVSERVDAVNRRFLPKHHIWFQKKVWYMAQGPIMFISAKSIRGLTRSYAALVRSQEKWDRLHLLGKRA